jgi:hypothetical protein
LEDGADDYWEGSSPWVYSVKYFVLSFFTCRIFMCEPVWVYSVKYFLLSFFRVRLSCVNLFGIIPPVLRYMTPRHYYTYYYIIKTMKLMSAPYMCTTVHTRLALFI